MGDFAAIAEQFVNFYYQTFDNDRSGLVHIYGDDSMMTWEKDPFQSAASIVEKLVNLPFQKVVHRVDTRDAQPGVEPGSITVLVTGALQIDDAPQPMSYVQTFFLRPRDGSYYVYNDMFRLVYPAA